MNRKSNTRSRKRAATAAVNCAVNEAESCDPTEIFGTDIPANWKNVPTAPREDPEYDEWIVGQAVGAVNKVYVTHLQPPFFIARVLYKFEGIRICFFYPNPSHRMTTIEENPWTYLILKEIKKMDDAVEAHSKMITAQVKSDGEAKV